MQPFLGTPSGTVALGLGDSQDITAFGDLAIFAADSSDGFEPWITARRG